MASDGIAYCILIQNEQLEQMDTFPYLGSLITEDGECTKEFHARLNRGRRLGITAENMEKSKHTDFSEDTTNESVRCSKYMNNENFQLPSAPLPQMSMADKKLIEEWTSESRWPCH